MRYLFLFDTVDRLWDGHPKDDDKEDTHPTNVGVNLTMCEDLTEPWFSYLKFGSWFRPKFNTF